MHSIGGFVDSIALTCTLPWSEPPSVFGSIGFRQMEECCLRTGRGIVFHWDGRPILQCDIVGAPRRSFPVERPPHSFPTRKAPIPMSSRKISRRQFVGTTSFMALGLPVVLGRAYPAFGAGATAAGPYAPPKSPRVTLNFNYG